MDIVENSYFNHIAFLTSKMTTPKINIQIWRYVLCIISERGNQILWATWVRLKRSLIDRWFQFKYIWMHLERKPEVFWIYTSSRIWFNDVKRLLSFTFDTSEAWAEDVWILLPGGRWNRRGIRKITGNQACGIIVQYIVGWMMMMTI